MRFTKWILSVGVAACVAGTAPVYASIIYVDDTATGPIHDGSSWCQAYLYLQDAIAAARDADGAVSEIRIAQGTYRPDQGQAQSIGDIDASFGVVDGVTYSGGYAGCGADVPDEYDPDNYATVLSGDLLGNDIEFDDPGQLADEPTRQDNSIFIFDSFHEEVQAFFRGLMFMGANGTGVRLRYGSASFDECRFEAAAHRCIEATQIDLCVLNSRFEGSFGPAIFVDVGDLSVVGTTFENNGDSSSESNQGPGAIYGSADKIEIVDCIFRNNGRPALFFGGAVNVAIYDYALIQDCVFENNVARQGSAVHLHNSGQSKTIVRGCTFLQNETYPFGGLPSFYEFGGALVVNGPSVVDKCSFIGNFGHGFSRCAGIASGSADDVTISNSVFSGNSSYGATAIMCTIGIPNVTNCTFSRNWANEYHAGIRSHEGLNISNSIFWENSDASGMAFSSQLSASPNSPITIDYSCVQNLPADFPGVENTAQAPRFVNPNGPDQLVGTPDDDLRLLPDSPCIDAGDPFTLGTIQNTDLLGTPRFLCDRVDMGSYEFGMGDADCDRQMTLYDYAAFQVCRSDEDDAYVDDACRIFDFDHDGDSDLEDFDAWLGLGFVDD